MSNNSSTAPTVLQFALLSKITDGFSEKSKVGSGGYGEVYKGKLDNGEEIAVKKLYLQPGLDDKQFRNELYNLTKVQHENIVRLAGYCYEIQKEFVEHVGRHIFVEREYRILCFEYLQGGSLDKHLYEEHCGLDWHTRYKIIKGICEGLNYLHGLKEPILHLDLKPANILLDENMVPKIADFGLSRLCGETQTHITKNCIGTRKYMPPEFIQDCKITKKYDVFSLGVIIIEIMTGREGYSKYREMSSSSEQFIELVHENREKRLQATMSRHTSLEVKTCIEIALRCVEADRVKRPTITEIVDELNNIDTAKTPLLGQDWLAPPMSEAPPCSPPPPPSLPLLALDNGTLYTLPRGERFLFPDCGGRYHSTCANWLVFSRDDGFFLVNPISMATMTLPGLSCVQPRQEADDEHVADDKTLTWMEMKDPKEPVMHKLIVCSPHLVAALVGFPGIVGNQIVVCQPGGSSWSVPAHVRFMRLRSMAFHQGELYALNLNTRDYNMDLLAVDISVDHSTGDPWVSRIRLVIKPEHKLLPGASATILTTLYLVESHGALLMVRRNIQCRKTLKPDIDGEIRQVAVRIKSAVRGKGEFEAFEADFGRSRWNKVTTVGPDQVLFLERWSSRAVSGSKYGMPGNRIFFFDDDIHDELNVYWYDKESSTSCSAYDMGDGTVSSPLPMISWKHGMVPATWLFPQD